MSTRISPTTMRRVATDGTNVLPLAYLHSGTAREGSWPCPVVGCIKAIPWQSINGVMCAFRSWRSLNEGHLTKVTGLGHGTQCLYDNGAGGFVVVQNPPAMAGIAVNLLAAAAAPPPVPVHVQLNQALAQLGQAQANIAQLQAQMAQAQGLMARAQAQVALADARITQHEARINQLENQAAVLEERMTVLEEELAELKGQRDA